MMQMLDNKLLFTIVLLYGTRPNVRSYHLLLFSQEAFGGVAGVRTKRKGGPPRTVAILFLRRSFGALVLKRKTIARADL